MSYEAGHLEREILETKVHSDDPILAKISERLAVELPSGLNCIYEIIYLKEIEKIEDGSIILNQFYNI